MIAIVTKFARADGHALKWKIKKKKGEKVLGWKQKRETTGLKKKEMTHFCVQENTDLSKSCICLPKLFVRRLVIVVNYQYICWLPQDYVELGHFTFLFCRGRQTNVQRFIIQVHSCTVLIIRSFARCCFCRVHRRAP